MFGAVTGSRRSTSVAFGSPLSDASVWSKTAHGFAGTPPMGRGILALTVAPRPMIPIHLTPADALGKIR
jgi:hypothetical protein